MLIKSLKIDKLKIILPPEIRRYHHVSTVDTRATLASAVISRCRVCLSVCLSAVLSNIAKQNVAK